MRVHLLQSLRLALFLSLRNSQLVRPSIPSRRCSLIFVFIFHIRDADPLTFQRLLPQGNFVGATGNGEDIAGDRPTHVPNHVGKLVQQLGCVGKEEGVENIGGGLSGEGGKKGRNK